MSEKGRATSRIEGKTPEPSTKKADESLAKVAKEEVALSKKEVEEFNEIIADVIGEAALEVEGVREVVAAIAEEEKKMAASADATAAAAKEPLGESPKSPRPLQMPSALEPASSTISRSSHK